MYNKLRIKVEAIAEKYADLVDKRVSTALREDLKTGVVMNEVTDGIRMLAHVTTTLERIDHLSRGKLSCGQGEVNDSDIDKVAQAIAGDSHKPVTGGEKLAVHMEADENQKTEKEMATQEKAEPAAMENGLTAQSIAEHYGYSAVANKRGCWKNETGILEKIRLLPEVLDATKKLRVIIDYDPEFSRVLVQVFEDQPSTQGQPDGKIGDDLKSS